MLFRPPTSAARKVNLDSFFFLLESIIAIVVSYERYILIICEHLEYRAVGTST